MISWNSFLASVNAIPVPIDENIESEDAVNAEDAGTCSRQCGGTELNSNISSTNEDILFQISPISKWQQLKRKTIGNRRKTTAAVFTDGREKEMLPSVS